MWPVVGASIATLISVLAAVISLLSLRLNRRLFRESFRPVVTARIATVAAGNIATLYKLVLENSGNRPAINIRLSVEANDLKRVLDPVCRLDVAEITNCFDEQYTIPILANGKSVSTAFGKTSAEGHECMWMPDSRFRITITYYDLSGRRYKEENPLFVFCDLGFAGFHYAD
jgi:hypothetical protein